MTPIAALLCISVGWAHLPQGRRRFEMAAIQLGQWAAVLVAMYLIHVSNIEGLVTLDALGSILLTLLALGVFISGLYLRTWKLCVAGGFLALAVPFVAWFAAASLFIFLIGVVLIALDCSFGGERTDRRSRVESEPWGLGPQSVSFWPCPAGG